MITPLPIDVPQSPLEELCRRLHIRRLSFFGSVLRADFRADSEVDVLVEFEPGHRIGLWGVARIERELSELLGRKVDLRTPAELSRYIRDEVLQVARAEYAIDGGRLDEAQRACTTSREGRFHGHEGEGIDPILREARLAALDTRRLPCFQRSACGHLSQHLENSRTEMTAIKR